MAYIKRGEAKTVPVRVKFNDMDVFPIGNVDEIAFKLGDSVRKTWPDAVRYDNANDRFMLTLTQEDTLSLDVGQAELEITCNFKGASLPASNDGKSIAVSYSETATFKVAGYIYNGYSWNTLKFTTVGDIVTITGPSEHYLRLSLICTDASAVIATINEPIT